MNEHEYLYAVSTWLEALYAQLGMEISALSAVLPEPPRFDDYIGGPAL